MEGQARMDEAQKGAGWSPHYLVREALPPGSGQERISVLTLKGGRGKTVPGDRDQGAREAGAQVAEAPAAQAPPGSPEEGRSG